MTASSHPPTSPPAIVVASPCHPPVSGAVLCQVCFNSPLLAVSLAHRAPPCQAESPLTSSSRCCLFLRATVTIAASAADSIPPPLDPLTTLVTTLSAQLSRVLPLKRIRSRCRCRRRAAMVAGGPSGALQYPAPSTRGISSAVDQKRSHCSRQAV
jgi:hypothetical protein